MDRLHVDPGDGPLRRRRHARGRHRRRAGRRLSTRRRGLRAPLAAHGAARARLGARRSTATRSPTPQGIPSPLDALSDGRRACRSAQRLDAAHRRARRASSTTSSRPSDGHAFARLGPRAFGAPPTTGTSLDAHTAAIRGLLVAYLATGATKYRDRARERLRAPRGAFYDPTARIYRAAAGRPSLT